MVLFFLVTKMRLPTLLLYYFDKGVLVHLMNIICPAVGWKFVRESTSTWQFEICALFGALEYFVALSQSDIMLEERLTERLAVI